MEKATPMQMRAELAMVDILKKQVCVLFQCLL